VKRTLSAIAERSAIRFALIWLLLFIAGASWAIATPLGGSPDEPAHIIKAASVARGDVLGEATDQPAVRSVTVPKGLASAARWPCYAFDGTKEANCLSFVNDDWYDVSAKTTAGLYNPTFYAIVGWPSLLLDDASAAVMAMRLVNALVTSLFLAFALVAMLKFGSSRIVVAAIAAAITPMVLFLNSAVNPNGLEIATGAALLASLLHLVRGDLVAKWPWLLITAVSGVILAQCRGLSPLWLGLFGLAAIIAARPGRLAQLLRLPSVWLTVAALLGGVLAAGAWILRTNTLGSMGVFPGADEVTPDEAFIEMLFARTLDPGYIGVFGWLDTPAAPIAYVTWSFLALAVLITAIGIIRGRALAAVAFALVTFILVPPIVQAASVETSGYIWQGRYALVGYVGVLIVAGVLASESNVFGGGVVPRRALHRIDVTVLSIVAFAQAFTLLHATKRYAVGTDVDWLSYFEEPQWSPPLGVYVWPLLVGASVALLFVTLRARGDDDADSATGDAADAVPDHADREVVSGKV
jgi:hypothetical protein